MPQEDTSAPSTATGHISTPGAAQAHAWLAHYPQHLDWHKQYSAKPLFDLLDSAITASPSRICTNFLGKTISYHEIGDSVNRAAAGLIELGIGKGNKVGLFLPNSPTFIVYYFAALKIGATVVNYNPLYTHEELLHQVNDSQTDIMVTLDLKILFDKVERLIADGALKRAVVASFPSLLPGAKSVLFRLLKSRDLAKPRKSKIAGNLVFEDTLLANDGRFTPAVIDPYEDLAVLQYTGGTTGRPKGAMLTHANLYINTMQVIDWAGDLTKSDQRVLGVLPFFHVFAMTVVMNFAVAAAAEIVIMPRFVLDDALKLIDKTKPTVMPGVPTLYNAMIHHPKLQTFDLSSLQFCFAGGAALPLDVKQRFENLTGCKLVEGYGLSETSPVATANPLDGPIKENSIGQPVPQTTISLRDLSDPSQEVPFGEKGEICIRGPQVMKGYWNNPEATESAFVGEFFRSGDVAVMDEEGFFYIVDRIKDLIICSGYNVYPRRIEEALYDHPMVEEATVIGIKDDYRGEAPKAFVKLRQGASTTIDDLFAHLKPKLSKIELPAEIELRAELPKTMIGKLSKKELKAEEEARGSSQTGEA
ncbi:MAG: long-chain-fatty-acid--CoA ligase [Hyphomicrobiaceae bacterium]